MIQSALESPDLRKTFKYLERYHISNFREPPEVQKFAENWWKSEISKVSVGFEKQNFVSSAFVEVYVRFYVS